jgi:hypothetical protein
VYNIAEVGIMAERSLVRKPNTNRLHQDTALRVSGALRNFNIAASQETLVNDVTTTSNRLLAEQTRQTFWGNVFMDHFTSKVIQMADDRKSILRRLIGKQIIKHGLGYAMDQMLVNEAAPNALENPIIATGLAVTEISPTIAAGLLSAAGSIVPGLGNVAGFLTGEAGDVAVGTMIAGLQGRSYWEAPDISDPDGRDSIRHWGAEGVIAATGPTPFLNTTISLAFMRSLGRSLMRQLQNRPEYRPLLESTAAHAAAINLVKTTVEQARKEEQKQAEAKRSRRTTN